MYAAIPSDYLLASQESVTLRQLAQEKMVFSAGNSKNVVLAQFQAQNIKIPHELHRIDRYVEHLKQENL